MIIDITGTILIPGNLGKDCPGNGTDPKIECRCDECDYMQCCLDDADQGKCTKCKHRECPRAGSCL